jgi:hypothetical protein
LHRNLVCHEALICKHLNVWDPPPNTLTLTGPDSPLPQDETLPLTYHAQQDIA